MNKTTLSVIFYLILTTKMYAQNEKNEIIFGIKGGYNHSGINGFETNGSNTGFSGSTVHGSLFCERSIDKAKFIGAELTFTWLNDWNFVEVPIHFREMISKQISIFAGPKLDLAIDRIVAKEKEVGSQFLGISAESGLNIILAGTFLWKQNTQLVCQEVFMILNSILIKAGGMISAWGLVIVFRLHSAGFTKKPLHAVVKTN